MEGEKEPEGTTGEDGDYIFFLQKMLSTEIKVKICDISEYQIYTEHNCHERATRDRGADREYILIKLSAAENASSFA